MKDSINLLILIVMLIGCDVMTPIDKKAEDYVSRIELKKLNMTEIDWANADKEIENLQQKIEQSRSSMTPEQLAHANKAIGRYYALRVKNVL